jgi:two-component system CitB family sensor kinase
MGRNRRWDDGHVRILRRTTIAKRLFALQLAGIVVLIAAGVTLWWFQARSDAERDATATSRSVALGVADNPFVLAALDDASPSAVLQPYAEDLMRDTGVDFVTIMATDRTRYTHRDPEEIGRPFLGSIDRALAGGTFSETYAGTLGPSVRTVAPITDGGGRVVALVSAGVTLSNIDRSFASVLPVAAAAALAMAALGAAGSLALSRYLRRVTGGRGPEELANMFAYYESVLRSVREGLVVTDGRERILLYNDQAAALLGLPRSPGSMHPVPLADLDLPPAVRDLLETGRVAVDETYLTEDRILLVNQQPAGEGIGGTADGAGSVTTIRDRTELEVLTGELRSAQTLSAALRSQTHEFSNRLHTIVSLIELGRADDALAFAEGQLGASQRLADRVTGAVREPVISALLLGKTTEATERGIDLHLDTDPRLGRVRVDPADIVTILGNLVDNALDAAGGDEPWVEVYLGLDDEGLDDDGLDGDGLDGDGLVPLVLHVSDSGSGLAAGEIDQAFERGFSTKAQGELGRGYGLALVRQTVARLGGRIEVEREPRSEFTVVLPDAVAMRSSADEADRAAADGATRPDVDAATGGDRR